MRRKILIRIAGLLLLPAALAAQSTEQRVYQWTDSKGVVHYSQFEPDNTPAQARDLHSASGEPAPSAAPAKSSEQSACDVATANLAMLSAGKDVPLTSNKDADGKPIPMTAEEVAAAKDLAQRQIDHFCKQNAEKTENSDGNG
jgi:hypothetical protein